MKPCVFEERGYRCVWFQCTDCAWWSHSADEPWSRRAAEVHAEHLRPGHRVIKREPTHQGVRIDPR